MCEKADDISTVRWLVFSQYMHHLILTSSQLLTNWHRQPWYHLHNISIRTYFLRTLGNLAACFSFFPTLHLCVLNLFSFASLVQTILKVSLKVLLYHNQYSNCWPGLSRFKVQQFPFVHLLKSFSFALSELILQPAGYVGQQWPTWIIVCHLEAAKLQLTIPFFSY